MLNYSVLPHTTITGRITNNHLHLRYSKNRHTPYLIMILYLQDGHTAHLAPVIAFNNRAKSLYQDAKQGDLLSVQANIKFHYYKGYLNASLMVSDWSFRESANLRAIIRKQPLHRVFPFIPDNYPKYLLKSRQQNNSDNKERPMESSQSNSSSSSDMASAVASVMAESSAQNEATNKSQSAQSSEEKANQQRAKKARIKESSTADWIGQLNKVTKFAFPTMN